MKVKLRNIAFGVIVLAALAGTGWFGFRYLIADVILTDAFPGLNIAALQYDIESVDTDGMILGDVRIDDIATADRIELQWALPDVLGGRLTGIVITQPVITGDFAPDRQISREYAAYRYFRHNISNIAERFGSLSIVNLQLHRSGQSDDISIDLSARFDDTPSAITGIGSWSLRSSHVNAGGNLNVTTMKSDRQCRAEIGVDHGAISIGWYRATDVSGRLLTNCSPSSKSLESVELEITRAELAFGSHSIGMLSGTAAFDGSEFASDLSFVSVERRFEVDAELIMTRNDDGMRVVTARGMRGRFSRGSGVVAEVIGDGRFEIAAHDTRRLDRLDGLLSLRLADGITDQELDIGEAELELAVALSPTEMDINLVRLAEPVKVRWSGSPILNEKGGPPAFTLDLAQFSLNGTLEENQANIAHAVSALVSTGASPLGQVELDGTTVVPRNGSAEASLNATIDAHLDGQLVPDLVFGDLRINGDVTGSWSEWTGLLNLDARLDRVENEHIAFHQLSVESLLEVTGGTVGLSARTRPEAHMKIGSVRAAAFRIDNMESDVPLEMNLENGIFDIWLTGTSWTDIGALEHEKFRLLEPTSLRLERELLPLLVVQRLGDDLSVDLRLLLDPANIRVALMHERDVLEIVSGTIPETGLRLEFLGPDHFQLRTETEKGDMLLEQTGVRARGIRVLTNYNNGLSIWPQINAKIQQIEDVRESARVRRGGLELLLTPVWRENHDLNVVLNVHLDDARYLANVEARYHQDADEWKGIVRVPSIVFETGGQQPADLFPVIGQFLTDVDGSFEVQGKLSVDEGETGADVRLTFYGLNGQLAETEFHALNGEINFSDFLPLKSAENQRLTIDELDTGLPVRDLVADITVVGGRVVQIHQLHGNIVGGAMHLESPVVLDVMSGRQSFVAGVRGVWLYALFGEFGLQPDLSGAMLDGIVEFEIGDRGLIVTGFKLRSVSPNRIRLVDPSPGTGEIEIDFQSLTAHFERRNKDGSPVSGRAVDPFEDARVCASETEKQLLFDLSSGTSGSEKSRQ